MAIRMRRGLESELDISKAIPGEWLVSTDTRYVRMCFAPGIVLRIATYEAFEADTKKFIQQMESILSETKTVQEAVERIQSEIEDSVVTVENYVESSKGYSNLSNTYALQSKGYAEEANRYADDAYEEAERAKMYAENASAVTDVQIATQDHAGIIKGGENYITEDGTLQLTKRATDRTLHNSYEGGIRINEIGGASEQGSTTGAQLFEFTKGLNASSSGVEVKENADGSLSIVGEATEGGGIFALGSKFSGEDVVKTLKAGSYFVSGLPDGLGVYLYKTGESVLNVYVKGGDAGFALEEDTDFCSISLRWSAGVTFNSPNTKIMLNAGAAALPWEPYTGGIASPSPDYPQEIKSVVISEIKTVGKNLLQNTAVTQSINGIDFTVNEDKSVTVNGTATDDANINISDNIPIEPGVKYRVLSGVTGSSSTTYRLLLRERNEDFANIRTLTILDDYTFTPSENAKYFKFELQVLSGISVNNLTFKPMLQKADISDATYEPYKENAITLSNPITLDGIGDAMDKIVRKDGAWGAERVIHNYTPGGVSKLAEEGTFGVIVMPGSVKPRLSTPNILCNVCEATTTLEIGKTLDYAICCYGNFLYLRNADIENKAAAYNTWLKNNTVTVFYERAESVFEPLPDVDQIALNSLRSFDSVTYLSCDSEIEPVIDVEYGTSKVGGLALDAQNKYDVGKFIVDKCAVKENTQLYGRVLIRNPENPNNMSAFNMTAYGDNDTMGIYAAAIGFSMSARGSYTFAHGSSGQTNGTASAVIAADDAVANGNYAFATGTGTRALSRTQFVSGKYNVEDTAERYAYIIGNGTNDKKRSNAFAVDWDGNAEFSGMLKGQLPYRASYLQVSNWQVSTEYDGFGYTQEVSLDGYYDRYPEYFLKTLSNGIVPTEAEKTAFELISAMKLDTSDIEHPKLIFYATDKPSTALLVIVKGVL